MLRFLGLAIIFSMLLQTPVWARGWSEQARVKEKKVFLRVYQMKARQSNWKFITAQNFRKPYQGFTKLEFTLKTENKGGKLGKIKSLKVVFKGPEGKKKTHIYSGKRISKRFGKVLFQNILTSIQRITDASSPKEMAEKQFSEFMALSTFFRHTLIQDPEGLNSAPNWKKMKNLRYRLDYVNGEFQFAEVFKSKKKPGWIRFAFQVKAQKVQNIKVQQGCSFDSNNCLVKNRKLIGNGISSKHFPQLSSILRQEDFTEKLIANQYSEILGEMRGFAL